MMKQWIWVWSILMILIGAVACQVTDSPPQKIAQATMIDTSVKEESEVQPEPPAIAIDTTISLDYLMGKFNPAKDSHFVKIAMAHATRGGMLLRREAYAAFVQMAEAAAKEGISLKILSATRNFNRQKSIWEAKWTGARKVDGQNLSETIKDPVARARKILQWSSMPGSSRHHWGTDIDINALENKYFASGRGQKEYQWLEKHASTYGFCQPYSPKGSERPQGYNEEKWHWSYLPIALPLTQQAKLRLSNDKFLGFKGAEAATGIDIVQHYILGINKACLD